MANYCDGFIHRSGVEDAEENIEPQMNADKRRSEQNHLFCVHLRLSAVETPFSAIFAPSAVKKTPS